MNEMIKEFLPRMKQELGITYDMEDIGSTEDVVIATIEQGNFALAFIKDKGRTIGIEVLCPPYSRIEDAVRFADEIQNMDGLSVMVNAKDAITNVLYANINGEIRPFTFGNWDKQ